MKEINLVKIRPFRISDLSKILEIELDSFPVPWHRNVFELMFTHEDSCFMIAERNNQVIGYIITIIEEGADWVDMRRAKVGHILNLAVDRKMRRQGIGKTLVKYILKDLKERKVEKVYLEVRESNIPAQKLYSKFNFKMEKRIKRYYQSGEDAYLLSKNIE